MQTWQDMTLGELVEEIESADGDIFPTSRAFIVLAEVMEKILKDYPEGVPETVKQLAADFVNGMGTFLDPIVFDLALELEEQANKDSDEDEEDDDPSSP